MFIVDWKFTLAVILCALAVVATRMWRNYRKQHRALAAQVVANAKAAAEARAQAKADADARAATQTSSYSRGNRGYEPEPTYYSEPEINLPNAGVNDAGRRQTIALRSMVGLWATGLLFALLSCVAFVGANAIAVNVNVGRYNGIIGSTGAKLPWSTNDEFSTRLQTSIRNWTEKKDEPDNCVTVKAAGVGACVDATVRWKIDYNRDNPATRNASNDKIVKLWRSYGDFDNVQEKLVDPETNTAFGNVYGTYSATEAFGGSKTAVLNDALVAKLNAALVPYGIVVDGITLGVAHLSDADQASLNKLFLSEQDIKTAENEAAAATQRAAANNNLRPSLTREVLIEKCIAAQAAAKPAVFDDCGLDDSATGSKTPVIVSPPAR